MHTLQDSCVHSWGTRVVCFVIRYEMRVFNQKPLKQEAAISVRVHYALHGDCGH